MYVFLAMSESLLTFFFVFSENVKKHNSVSTCFNTQNLKKIEVYDLTLICISCVSSCADWHQDFMQFVWLSHQDHRLYTTLKINQSSCNIQCELMEADS